MESKRGEWGRQNGEGREGRRIANEVKPRKESWGERKGGEGRKVVEHGIVEGKKIL